MADKKTELSITIRAVDAATARIKAINDRLDALTKPTRDFKKALGDLGEKSGLGDVVSGFKGVGSAIEGVLAKVAVIGGVAGLAVHGLLGLVKEFDDLGDTADRVGLTADQLAALRYAAEKAGAPIEALDESAQKFSENLGQLRANAGRLNAFLPKISTNLHKNFGAALAKQLRGAKDNAEALGILADAMAKLPDPAERAALAQKTLGDSSLAPLLAKGSKGIKELTDRYHVIAPGMQKAADAGGEVDDKLIDLHASIQSVKGALLTGLKPALVEIIDKMQAWLTGHQAEIEAWAENVGKKLPGAVHELVDWLGKAYDKVTAFVGAVGGIGNVAIGAVAIGLAPLAGSVVSLGNNLFKVLGKINDVGKALEAGGGKAAGFGNALQALSGVGTAFAIAEGLNQISGGSKGTEFWSAAQKGLNAKIAARDGTGGPDAIVERGLGGSVRALLAGGRPDMSEQAQQLLAPSSGGFEQMRDAFTSAIAVAMSGKSTEAKVTIDITGAPRGTRVKSDPQSTTDVDLSVGYNLMGAP